MRVILLVIHVVSDEGHGEMQKFVLDVVECHRPGFPGVYKPLVVFVKYAINSNGVQCRLCEVCLKHRI